jgi:hypothetical protein
VVVNHLRLDVVPSLAKFADASGEPEAPEHAQRLHRVDALTALHVRKDEGGLVGAGVGFCLHHARSFRFDFFAGFVRSHQIAFASLINAFNTSPLARLGVRFA